MALVLSGIALLMFFLRFVRRMAYAHVAGTSCVAFAPNGAQKGVRDASIVPFLAWVGLRIALQEPIVLHENSKRFPTELLLQRLLGHLYVIDPTDVEALCYGGTVRRERKLTRLIHRQKAMLPDSPSFMSFNARFFRECSMHWKEYYWQHLETDVKAKDSLPKPSVQCKA